MKEPLKEPLKERAIDGAFQLAGRALELLARWFERRKPLRTWLRNRKR